MDGMQGRARYDAVIVGAGFAGLYMLHRLRSQGLSAMRLSGVRQALADAERAAGAQRQSALAELSGQLDGDASGGARHVPC